MTNRPWTKDDPNKLLKAATERALEAVGLMLEGAVIRVPVPQDTGRLKGSISYATQKVPSRVKGAAKAADGVSQPGDAFTLHVGTNVEYATYVEYGTRRWPPGKPYLRPALDANRKTAQRLYADKLAEAFQNGR